MTTRKRSKKPPISTPASDAALIMCAFLDSSNSFAEKKSSQVSRPVGTTKPISTRPIQNSGAHVPATMLITESKPAGEL